MKQHGVLQVDKNDVQESEQTMVPFHQTLALHNIKLNRNKTSTLQINVGSLCNQACRHCHLNAGPGSKNNMKKETAEEVIAYAKRGQFEVVDITGGAPELNDNLERLIIALAPITSKVILRSNLAALFDGKKDNLIDLIKLSGVVIVASFPSLNEVQTDAQRGGKVFAGSILALKKLNAIGYGVKGSGLELNLVSNPTGAFLPPSQEETEKRFRLVLQQKWGIVFNHLFNFANVPLGRFRNWLIETDNLNRYLKRLYAGFNPCAVERVMCRTLVSVSPDGYLYDCDFNYAAGLYMGGNKTHISGMDSAPVIGSKIATMDHCYTCTSGSGFT
jgi:radical SAM/Cys-rich protein